GRAHQALPTSITIGLKGLDEVLEEGKRRIAEGFRIIKLKIGVDPDLEIEKFVKLREQLGNDIKIRVDANQGYSVEDTQAFFEATQSLDLEFMEQPLRPNNLDGMHRLSRKIREKCAADEIMQKPKDALLLAQSPKAFGIFNIKLMKCGGLSPALEIARIAQRSNIELMWGCNDESAVSISAALHTALACPATRYLDLDGSLDLGDDFVSGGFELKDGLLHLGKQPGLGVAIKDMSKIDLLS
ncbi:MAG: enolase C-terminal domain-like protein, partial [Bacteroidota bacterium]